MSQVELRRDRMTDKEPSKEQVDELWDWCGLKWFWNHNPKCDCGAIATDSDKSWHYFSDGEYHLATRFWHEPMQVDLNNLFKYAVPRMWVLKIELLDGVFWSVKASCPDIHGEGKHGEGKTLSENITLALFWAIWEAIKK